ncbi:MAG TPA: efflux RND transporter periplasmic adaptor subunit, partial [Polyangiaceae bacterium]|nr:efflux RND transporter periplasmic adaptor subunit [Polyangiaceae bacterium]
KLGETVKKGDVLAVLDSVDVAEMQGEILSAQERLTLAKAEYERKKKLYDEKITSQKEFLAAKQRYAEAKVELRSAQRALGAKTGGSGSGGGYALVAPLSGTIVGWHLGVGEVLEEDARAFTIADLSSVWVNVTVYAKDLPRVRLGQRVLIRAEGIDHAVEGRISYLSQLVVEATRSATARVVLQEPGEAWRPGLFVTAEVEIDEVEADVVVPEGAVQRLEGKHVVFVREGNLIEARAVVLGRHGHAGSQPVVEIIDGLKAGEPFVDNNSFMIKAELGKSSAGHSH